MGASTRPAHSAVSSTVGPRAYGWLALTVLFAASVVVAARVWFDTLQRVWPTLDPTLKGCSSGAS